MSLDLFPGGKSALTRTSICAFGNIFGAMCTAYIGTFGPMSGNRTLVCLHPQVCCL